MAQFVRHLTFDFSSPQDFRVMGSSPTSGSTLTPHTWDSLSSSASAPLPACLHRSCSFSLLINSFYKIVSKHKNVKATRNYIGSHSFSKQSCNSGKYVAEHNADSIVGNMKVNFKHSFSMDARECVSYSSYSSLLSKLCRLWQSVSWSNWIWSSRSTASHSNSALPILRLQFFIPVTFHQFENWAHIQNWC